MPKKKANRRSWIEKNGFKSVLENTTANILKDIGMGFEYEKRTFPWKEKMPSSCFCAECGSKEIYADRNYTPDFFLDNGIIIECKGFQEVKDRKIAEAMQKQYPDIDLRFVFLRDNTLTPKSKTRYSRWCQKRGFKYAFASNKHQMKMIIKEWCKE